MYYLLKNKADNNLIGYDIEIDEVECSCCSSSIHKTYTSIYPEVILFVTDKRDLENLINDVNFPYHDTEIIETHIALLNN